MAFSMYDMNSSGDLSTKEISVMIKECYGEISDNHNVWTILECFDANEDSKVSRNEFVVQCKKHPALLAPAINFQVKLMGMISKKKSFWNKIYLTSGRYSTFYQSILYMYAYLYSLCCIEPCILGG